MMTLSDRTRPADRGRVPLADRSVGNAITHAAAHQAPAPGAQRSRLRRGCLRRQAAAPLFLTIPPPASGSTRPTCGEVAYVSRPPCTPPRQPWFRRVARSEVAPGRPLSSSATLCRTIGLATNGSRRPWWPRGRRGEGGPAGTRAKGQRSLTDGRPLQSSERERECAPVMTHAARARLRGFCPSGRDRRFIATPHCAKRTDLWPSAEMQPHHAAGSPLPATTPRP